MKFSTIFAYVEENAEEYSRKAINQSMTEMQRPEKYMEKDRVFATGHLFI